MLPYSLETSTAVIAFLQKNAVILTSQIDELREQAKKHDMTDLDALLKFFPENEDRVADIIRRVHKIEKSYVREPEDLFFCVPDIPDAIFVKRADNTACLLIHDPQGVSDYFNYVIEQTVILSPTELVALTADDMPLADQADIEQLSLSSDAVTIDRTEVQNVNQPADDEIDEDAVRQLDSIIRETIKRDASDVHMEVDSDNNSVLYYRVRHRVDGRLKETSSSKNIDVFAGMLSQIKLKAGLKLDETRLPQDGRMNYSLKGIAYSFRVSTKPVVVVDVKHGGESQKEKIVIRKMPDISQLQLEKLDIHPYNLARLQAASLEAHGFNVITGPTGSGKTTTLYALLSSIDRATKNVSTIEDPVEAEIKGINQTQILPEIGLTFARVLRAELRQDPDIIMVGEMRDCETAEIAAEASLTGHLVFSTLHTKNAISSITRLINMGVPSFIVASAVSYCIAQRLMRELCAHCKEEVKDQDAILNKSMQPILKKIQNKKVKSEFEQAMKTAAIHAAKKGGCAECNGSGYKGRLAILEVFQLNETSEEVILHANADEVKLQDIAESEGMLTIEQDGLIKVMQGGTTIEELYTVLVA